MVDFGCGTGVLLEHYQSLAGWALCSQRLMGVDKPGAPAPPQPVQDLNPRCNPTRGRARTPASASRPVVLDVAGRIARRRLIHCTPFTRN